MNNPGTSEAVENVVGQEVTLVCHREGCENVQITVTLGEEIPVDLYPLFRQAGVCGRLTWDVNKPIKSYSLVENDGEFIHCPNCGAFLTEAIAVTSKDGEPIYFGLETEPA